MELCWKAQLQYIDGSTYPLICTVSTLLRWGLTKILLSTKLWWLKLLNSASYGFIIKALYTYIYIHTHAWVLARSTYIIPSSSCWRLSWLCSVFSPVGEWTGVLPNPELSWAGSSDSVKLTSKLIGLLLWHTLCIEFSKYKSFNKKKH